MYSESSGLSTVQSVNGVKVKATYYHPEYLVLRNCVGCVEAELDSARAKYDSSLTFLLNFGPNEEDGIHGDIMKVDVKNYKEYAERFLRLNFNMADYVSLRYNDLTVPVTIYSLENTFGLTDSRTAYLVFNDGALRNVLKDASGEIDLVFDAYEFELGRLKFRFPVESILSKPLFQLDNKTS